MAYRNRKTQYPMQQQKEAFAQYPIPSVNGAFRENGMKNPNTIQPTTRSPQQKSTQQKMGILNNPRLTTQPPAAINQMGSIPKPAPQVAPTPSIDQTIPSPMSPTPVVTGGGSIGLPTPPLSTPQTMPAPIIPNIQSDIGNGTQPYNPMLPPPPLGGISGGGDTSPKQPDVGGGGVPPLGGGLPNIPFPKTTAPPAGGEGTSPTGQPPWQPTGGGGLGGGTGEGTGGGTGQGGVGGGIQSTGQPSAGGSWQDYSQEAGTGSAQNPYSSIYGGMQGPLAYLRGQGIDIGQDYSRYFQAYDPAMEQGAYQQYGLEQESAMMGSRAGLMGITQQQGAGGFSGVGFGGAPSRGIRSQFGLGQQQATLGLRGDIYGMRREQEEDWWSTLARVEESRGEPFGAIGKSASYEGETPIGGGAGGGGTGEIGDSGNINPITQPGGSEGQGSGEAAIGAPSGASSGQLWTNNNGVDMKWSETYSRWMPSQQWDYYDSSNWSGWYG